MFGSFTYRFSILYIYQNFYLESRVWSFDLGFRPANICPQSRCKYYNTYTDNPDLSRFFISEIVNIQLVYADPSDLTLPDCHNSHFRITDLGR